MDNTDRAKTVQKPCNHGLQNKKAMKSIYSFHGRHFYALEPAG